MKIESLRTPAIVLACGCLILFLGFGVRATFGLFLPPMSMEYHWGREIFSLAMGIQNLLWGAVMALAGGIADRYGAGRVVAGAGFLLGLALAGTTFGVVLAVVARVTPPEKRSSALGLATAAGSFGQFALL